MRTFNLEIEGRRPLGRPRRRWILRTNDVWSGMDSVVSGCAVAGVF
jgi:hypothetical protein